MRSKRPVFTLLLAALALCSSAATQAGVPNPAQCTIDPCVRVCPGGDMTFHVVVRDMFFNPVVGSSVAVDFSNCPGVVFCPTLPGDPYTFIPPALVLMVSNAAGVADFPIRAGGVCQGAINVYADGINLALRNAASSPDQNGDLTVNAVDNGILAGKLGSANPTGDFNCSGLVEAGDTGIEIAHTGHSCQAVVPVNPKTWGTLKVLYR